MLKGNNGLKKANKKRQRNNHPTSWPGTTRIFLLVIKRWKLRSFCRKGKVVFILFLFPLWHVATLNDAFKKYSGSDRGKTELQILRKRARSSQFADPPRNCISLYIPWRGERAYAWYNLGSTNRWVESNQQRT
jgi:hypothetical protein